MGEKILRDMAAAEPGWQSGVLRYFNPVGAHESGRIGEDPRGVPNNLMPYVAQVAVGRRARLSVFGDDYDTPDGTGVRDYIHVVDLAQGHVKALDRLLSTPGSLLVNLGTGRGYSVLELIARLRTRQRPPGALRRRRAPRRRHRQLLRRSGQGAGRHRLAGHARPGRDVRGQLALAVDESERVRRGLIPAGGIRRRNACPCGVGTGVAPPTIAGWTCLSRISGFPPCATAWCCSPTTC